MHGIPTRRLLMAHVVLIACASKKREVPAPARDLYLSALFMKSLAYADSLEPDAIYILSAKHGLLEQDEVVAPYDETLNDKSAAEVRAWAEWVRGQLEAKTDPKLDHYTILAGMSYRKYLVTHLAHVLVPLEGLGIGKQLQRLDQLVREDWTSG